jgi:aminopeptidase N
MLFLLAVLPLHGFPDKEDSNIMAGKIDILHYSINIKIDPRSKFINATTSLTFNALTDLHQVLFNLKDMSISSCMLDNQPISFNYDANIIEINSSSLLQAGTKHNISFEYSGAPKDGLIISRNKYGNHCAFSDNWANRARFWFPSIDHPSDKATVSFNITTPKRFEVIANGTFNGTTSVDDTTSVYRYDMETPITTYCMVIGVADFSIEETKTSGGIPIYYYSFPEDKSYVSKEFKHVPEILDFYEKIIGPYPYSKLAIVESSTMFEGMENSSAIFLPPTAFGGVGKIDNNEILAHEIAHQWFGDDVSKSDWPELWLSEGFATYFTMLYFESRDGKKKYDEMIENTRTAYRMYSSKTQPVITNHYMHLGELLNVENYQKGALFLHTIRKTIGDELFFKGIREYYKRFEHSNATTKDFENVMEEISSTNLNTLFQRWLYEPGLPE